MTGQVNTTTRHAICLTIQSNVMVGDNSWFLFVTLHRLKTATKCMIRKYAPPKYLHEQYVLC